MITLYHKGIKKIETQPDGIKIFGQKKVNWFKLLMECEKVTGEIHPYRPKPPVTGKVVQSSDTKWKNDFGELFEI
jgi:hypothetical protein